MSTLLKKLHTMLLILILAGSGALAVSLSGCEDEGPVEEAAEEAGDDIEEATD
jgi:hypothetical protein